MEMTPKAEQKSDWFRVEVQCWALEQRLVHFLMLHIEDTEEGKDTSYTSHTPKMAHNDFVYWKGFSELLATFSQSQVSFLELIESIFQVYSLSILHRPHHPVARLGTASITSSTKGSSFRS